MTSPTDRALLEDVLARLRRLEADLDAAQSRLRALQRPGVLPVRHFHRLRSP